LKLASVHSIPLNVKVSGIYSTPGLIIRLEISSGWLTIDVWLGLQMEYDLAEAEKHAGKIKVRKIPDECRR
jgi:plasmid maintenance system antidote protein VapI